LALESGGRREEGSGRGVFFLFLPVILFERGFTDGHIVFVFDVGSNPVESVPLVHQSWAETARKNDVLSDADVQGVAAYETDQHCNQTRRKKNSIINFHANAIQL